MRILDQFISAEAISLLGYQNITDITIGDFQTRNLAIMFIDVRDFSTMCEHMDPKDVLKFLNSYYQMVLPIIKKYQGYIDKFIGDAIMGIFVDEQSALKCGIEIHRKLIEYNLQHRIGSRTPINIGMGISVGPVVIGAMGSNEKIEIAALSDTVNVASRLDGMCKELNARILISGIEIGKDLIDDGIQVIDHGAKRTKGKSKYIDVVELIDTKIVSEASTAFKTRDDKLSQKYLKSIGNFQDLKLKPTKSKRKAG